MKHLVNRLTLFFIGMICLASVTLPTLAQAEKLVESSLFFRILVASASIKKQLRNGCLLLGRQSRYQRDRSKELIFIFYSTTSLLSKTARESRTWEGHSATRFLLLLVKTRKPKIVLDSSPGFTAPRSIRIPIRTQSRPH